MRHARAPEAGFTLVEMLIGITLLSLLAGLLAASLRFGLLVWERGAEDAGGQDDTLAAQTFLRSAIGAAWPLFLKPDRARGAVAFDGTATRLALLAPTPLALGGSGRSRFTLYIEEHDGRTDLMITATPELTTADAGASGTVFLETIEAVAFSYFGRKRSDRRATWHDDWQGEPALPERVGIRVRFPEGDPRPWPELIVRPLIAVDVGCVYDRLTGRCRGR